MKQNQTSLTYFTIGETFQCFLKAQSQATQSQAPLIEESDIFNFILQEMVNQNLAEATEDQKLAIDYSKLYEIIDAMSILGFV